jgi:hypothetical protein
MTAVWFESAVSAAENSNRAEVSAFAKEFGKLCSDEPTFREFAIIEEHGRQ